MSEKRIALVHPDYQGKVFETLSIPLGLAWLSAYLKKCGFSVVCYDFALSQQNLKNMFNDKYDVIGFQLHSLDTLEESLYLIKEVKQKQPATKTIVGGIAATLLWNKLLDQRFIDFIVIGEGEATMVDLLNNIDDYSKLRKVKGIAFRHKGQKKFTGYRKPIRDLDDIPLPDRNAFAWKYYPQWSVVTSRGCPYRCSFCVVPIFWRGIIRLRSAGNVYNELRELEEKYNVRKFLFLDDVFSIDKPRVKELMNLIIKGKHDFEWACFTRADLVDKEILELFKKAGCVEISYGVESANQETLNLLNKGIRVCQIKKAIQLTKEIGIRVRCSFIFGLPNETKENISKTIDFMLETEPHEVQIYPLAPYPGTSMFHNRKKYGIKILSTYFKAWKKDALNPIAETKYLSREDIIEMVRLCVKRLKENGYVWIPIDKAPGKYSIEKCVMTVFSPLQSLSTTEMGTS